MEAVMAKQTADYEISGGGTVYLITPLNDEAKQNLVDNVSDEAQWLGNSLAVEHRYIESLVEQLKSEGWTVR
jgi:hypothetical protein